MAADELAAYGDRAPGASQVVGPCTFYYGTEFGATPNIIVDFEDDDNVIDGMPGNLHWLPWPDSYGDLLNNAYLNSTLPPDSSLSIKLIADPGHTVYLFGFDMSGWPFADYEIDSVRVLNGGGTVLFSAPLNGNNMVDIEGDLLDGPRHTAFDFDSPLSGSILEIEIKVTNGVQSNIGIDNIAFGQQFIPEPSAIAMLGLAAMIAWRRRIN